MSEEIALNRTKPFKWTAKKEEAARLLAEDALSDQKIADRIGGSKRQLESWKLIPEFDAKVKAVVAKLGEQSMRFVIARRNRRIGKLDRMLRDLERVKRERAADPRMADVPGGRTGLIVIEEAEVVTPEPLPEGVQGPPAPPFVLITETALDTGFLREFRELLKEAGVETGQRTEKRQITGPDGGAQVIALLGITLEQFDKLDPARKVAMLRSGAGV